MKVTNKPVYIVAGGTGGHINAALSLGDYFFHQQFEVCYLTGTRYLDFQLFKNQPHKVFHLEARALRASSLIKQIQSLVLNLFVFLTCLALFLRARPYAVIGCGGYICGPSLLAAKLLFVNVYILEQNAVMGFTNKLLSRIANKIFVNFERTKGLNELQGVIHTGNPIRSTIKYTEPNAGSPARVLVFGGSLGARQLNVVLSKIVREGIGRSIEVHHQVGKDGLFDITADSTVIYTQIEYIEDIAKEYAWADIIISRAGASTISELRVARRPSILLPYPHATDNHQEFNARQLKEEGKFYVVVKDPLKGDEQLAEEIVSELLNIIDNKMFIPYGDYVSFDPCEKIFKEVIKDVRNK